MQKEASRAVVSVRFIYASEDKLQQFQNILDTVENEDIDFTPVLCNGDVDLPELGMGGITFIEGAVLDRKSECPEFEKIFDEVASRFLLLIEKDEEKAALDFISKGAESYFIWGEFNEELLDRFLKITRTKGAHFRKGGNTILDSFYLRKIFDNAREAIAVIDPNATYLKVNAAYQDLFGYSEEYLLGKTPAVVIGEERMKKNMEFLRSNQGPLVKEVEIINKHGKPLSVELSIFPVENWKRETIAYVGINKDRTEEKEMRTLLEQSEEKFAKAFQTSPDAIAISRLSDGLYIEINDGFTRLTGYTKDDLRNKTTYDISLWHDDKQREELIDQMKDRDFVKDVEVKFRKKNGELRVGLMSVNILELKGVKYLLSITRDITDWVDVQEALIKSEANLRKAQEISHLGSWEIDYLHKIVNFSEEAGRILALPLTNLSIGFEKLVKLIDKETGKSFVDLIESSSDQPTNSFEGDIKIKHKNTSIHYGHIFGESERNKNNEIIRIQGAIQDITEAVLAREKIEERDNTLKQFVENTSDKITRTDLHGEIKFVTPTVKELLGYTQEEFIGTKIFEYIHPDDMEFVINSFKKAMVERVSNIEYRLKHKNGSYLWVESKGNAITDKDGDIIGLISGTSLIHDKKIALDQLKESEEKYRLLVQNNFDLISEIDNDGRITYISQNIQQLLGYAQSEVTGKSLDEFTHPADLKYIKSQLGKEYSNFSGRYKHQNGDWRWFESAGRTYSNLEGEIVTLFVSKDITERKAYEQALAESELKFRSLTENSRDIIMRFNRKHEVLYSNSAGETWFESLTPKDPLHVNDSILSNSTLRELKLCIEMAFSTREVQRMQFNINLNGEKKSYDWQGVPEFSASHNVESVLGVARDITAFTETQDELNKLHQVIQSSTNSIILTDKNGLIEHVNPKTLEITGYDYHELIGKNPRILKSGYTPDEVYKQLWDTITGGNAWKGEFYNRKKNGDLFWEFSIISPIKNNEGDIVNYLAIKEDITHQKKAEELVRQSKETLAMTLEANNIGTWSWDLKSDEFAFDSQAIRVFGLDPKSKKPHTSEDITRLVHPNDMKKVSTMADSSLEDGNTMDIDFRILGDDESVRHLITKSRITRNSRGKAVRLDGICMDVTETKEIEENLKIRNEELNQFVYKVSHDLRAPLASIRGIVELERIQNKNRPTIKHLDIIEERVLILDEFIRNILSHSRNLNTSVSYHVINFEKIISACFTELEFMNNALSVKRISKISGTTFFSDESRVYEIFRNLISNGIKYVDYNKPEPYIRINVKTTNKECMIEIEDNGVGIPAKYQDKVFNMFYRANEKSEGSGIGLYIVNQAVKKLGGKIKMRSNTLEGTTFTITLPNMVNK
jgi:PAS domain S-box-containing protein